MRDAPEDRSQGFVYFAKQQRANELLEELKPYYDQEWNLDEFVMLMGLLGIGDANYFIATGWWVPTHVRHNASKRDDFVDQLEEAIAAGDLPNPQEGDYTWSDFVTLLDFYQLDLASVVRNLIEEYALTFGETLLLDGLKSVKG